ncbi:MAG: hypothetical protein MJ071_03135 [Oscillospiraceae bacterium]|nr:hypothetical protein [Oscillospiraceae bacterium]
MEQNIVSLSGKQVVLKDQRGRISFPSAYRSGIGEILYVSPDSNQRGYLVVRSKDGYQQELERIRRKCEEDGLDEDDAHDEQMDFAKDTVTIAHDKNGRITLTAELLEYADLQEKVVVIGFGEVVEIWSEERLAAYEKERAELKKRKRAMKDARKKAELKALTPEEA